MRGEYASTVNNTRSEYNDIKLLVNNYELTDFGDTHSIALLVDSLESQKVISNITNNLSEEDFNKILSLSSNKNALIDEKVISGFEGYILLARIAAYILLSPVTRVSLAAFEMAAKDYINSKLEDVKDDNNRLYGGDKIDELYGGKSNDYLEGGKDFDTYIIQGKDTVFDSDREGKLVFVNMDKSADETPVHFARVAADQNDWVSVDEKKNRDNKFTATRINDDLVISQVGSDNQATIKQYFKQKDQGPVLGVQLFDDDEPVAPDMGDGFITGMPGKENVYSFNSSGSFKIKGTDTRDSINAGPLKAKDEKDFALVAYTGAGNDSVFGSFERDWIDGGDDADLLNGSPFVLPSKDWRDPIKKAKDSDTIIGGGGGDFINGMAGDDVLYANMQTSHLEKGNVVSMEQGDWVLGGEGDDRLYGSANQDFLQGGEGSDTVIGGAGNDIILGDGVMRADVQMKRMFHSLADEDPDIMRYVSHLLPGGVTHFAPELLKTLTRYPTWEHTFDTEGKWEHKGNQNANLPAELVSWSIKILREQGDYEINAPFKHQDKEEHRAASGGA